MGPKKGRPCECHKNASSQIGPCNSIPCSVLDQQVCYICGKRRPAEYLSREISMQDNLPSDGCDCFCKKTVPEEVSSRSELQSEAPSVQIYDSQNINIPPMKKESCYIDESCSISKKETSSSDEMKTPELSHSSNGYVPSPDESSSNQNLTDTKSSSSDSKNSPSTEKGGNSSGYPLSLDSLSLSESPGESNIKSPSSGEESKSTEKDFSSGYALSLGKQSTDQHFQQNISSPSSGEDSENKQIAKDTHLSNIKSNIHSENVNKCESSQSSSKHENNQPSRMGESSISQPVIKAQGNENVQYRRNISIEFGKIIRPVNFRYLSPTPFPFQPQQPYINPRRNLVAFNPYQPQRPYANIPVTVPTPSHYLQAAYPQFHQHSAMNLSITPTADVPERFSMSSRSLRGTRHQQNQPLNTGGLSRKVLSDVKKMDPEGFCIERSLFTEDWIMRQNSSEGPSASSPTAAWSAAENEENEGIPPGFSGTSTDERSSTEISEEENRRQMALRRPPRFLKRGKQK